MKKVLMMMTMLSFATGAAFAETTTEAIMGFTTDSDGVTFQVMSGGCTRKSDFQVMLLEVQPAQVLLKRVKMDGCEAYLPFGTKVTFSYSELGLGEGQEFRIGNPTSTLRSPNW